MRCLRLRALAKAALCVIRLSVNPEELVTDPEDQQMSHTNRKMASFAKRAVS
jgi:hypothetical protein